MFGKDSHDCYVCQSNGRGGLECTEIMHISVMGLKNQIEDREDRSGQT